MAIEINDHTMQLRIDGAVVAFAQQATDGRWEISDRRGRFNRNQAITAMVLAERLATSYGDDDPFVIGWREELTADDAVTP